MIDCTGTRFDFSVTGGVSEVVVLEWSRGDVVLDVANATFRMEGVGREDGRAVRFYVAHGARKGDLRVTVPAMSAGEYVYELWAGDDAGGQQKLLYGVVTADDARFGRAVLADAQREVARRLSVVVPDEVGAPLVLAWRASSAVGAVAEDLVVAGEDAVARARGEADRAKGEADRAKGEADRAELAAGRAEVSADEAQGASELAAQLRDNLRARLLEMIKVIDGYLYVDDVNTGHYLKGKDGLQVYISSDGHWYLSDGTYLGWPATGADGVTPHITAEGFWAFGDEVTQYRAIGKDGLDGTAVRRIVVDSYWDIPQEGETCNGGFYYYTQKANYHKAQSVVVHFEEGIKGFWLAGGEFPDFESVEEGESQINAVPEVYGCTAVAVDEHTLRLTALEGYGDVIVRCTEPGSYVEVPDTYAVYVWLEREGVGSWEWVGLAYDLATAEVHGLVKLGTDARVGDGAPVGNNASGQMRVPRSTVSSHGTGKLGTSAELTADTAGVVGMNSAGQYLARKADNSHYGTVMYSRTDNYARIISIGEVPMGTKVDGIERGGRLGSTRADANTYGMNKCSYTLTNAADFSDVVYVMPIGMRDDTTAAMVPANIAADNSDPWYFGANGHLAVKLKQDGALQWNSSGQGDRHGVSYSTGGYLWLRTNNSFSQSRAGGLSLKEATTSLLGGVRKMDTLTGTSNVPTGGAVLDYLTANYYKKGALYTKAEMPGVIDAEVQELVPLYAERELQAYATISWVNEEFAKTDWVGNTFLSKDDAQRVYMTRDELEELLEGFMRKTATWHGDEVMEQEAYDTMTSRDEKKVYLLI